MKKYTLLILCTASVLLTACSDEKKEVQNPVSGYLDSRVDAIDMAKHAVKENNQQIKKQDQLIDEMKKKSP